MAVAEPVTKTDETIFDILSTEEDGSVEHLPASKEIWDQKYKYKEEKTLKGSHKRMAKGAAQAEPKESRNKWQKEFERILFGWRFLPAGRIQANLGTDRRNATLSNCFVSETIEDSIEGIFDALKHAALTMRTGGGIGYDFSTLRPKDAWVEGVESHASGPLSFARVFDAMCKIISTAGSRRGAQMMVLRVDHPDIIDYIHAKRDSREIEDTKKLIRSIPLPILEKHGWTFAMANKAADLIDNAKSFKQFNMSVAVTDDFMQAVKDNAEWELKWKGEVKKTIKARKLWGMILENTYKYSEPGILFIDRMNRLNPLSYAEVMKATNPCLDGNTLVAVADGRGQVSIKQLAEEENDVPVYCRDPKTNSVKVRIMRNPRITGYNQQMYKITLDDSSFLRVTGNHKFILKDGSEVEAKDLKKGKSLSIMTKFLASLKDIFPKANSNSQDYMWINDSYHVTNKSEHRLIVEHNNNISVPKGCVVHHKDYNSLNNDPSNLQIMTKKDHDILHSKDMVGDKNPMRRAKHEWSEEKWKEYRDNMSDSTSAEKNGRYSGVTNEELKAHALLLTKKLGYRFSKRDWQKYALENKLPSQFSKWREDHFNGVLGFAKLAANELGLENIDCDPRVLKSYKKYLAEGYDCSVIDGAIYLNKNCETCGNDFKTHHDKREIAYCSRICVAKNTGNILRGRPQSKKVHERNNENKLKLRGKQIQVFLGLKEEKGHNNIMKSEWVLRCKQESVSAEMCRKSSPFISYASLKEAASNTNHKVMSVVEDGFDTVYNGTVDEFHNFFIGGFEGVTDKGKQKLTFVNILQCGEQPLSPYNSCNLGSFWLIAYMRNAFSPNAYFDYDALTKDCSPVVRLMDNVLEVNHMPLPEQRESMLSNRRLGIGFTGLANIFQMMGLKYGSDESVAIAEKIMQTITFSCYRASIELAKEKGPFPLLDRVKHVNGEYIRTFPQDIIDGIIEHGIRNSHLTSIAPTGTLSFVYNNVSGAIEPTFLFTYKRKVKTGKVSVSGIEEKRTVQCRDFAWEMYRRKFGQDAKMPDYFNDTDSVTVAQHVSILAAVQRWNCSAVSKTINIPKNYSFDDFKKVYDLVWETGVVKGCTTYIESSMEGVLLRPDAQGNAHALENEEAAMTERDPILYGQTFKRVADNRKWYITLNYLNNEPYEVLIHTNNRETKPVMDSMNDQFVRLAKRLKIKKEKIDEQLKRSGHEKNVDRLARLISLCLRHKATIFQVVETLQVNNGADVTTLKFHLKKIFEGLIEDGSDYKSKEKCPDCSGTEWHYVGGCPTCKDCSYSKCG